MSLCVQTFTVTNPGVQTVVLDKQVSPPFSWIDTITQPEDPFFAFYSTPTLSAEQIGMFRSEPGHKERFEELLKTAVKPKRSR